MEKNQIEIGELEHRVTKISWVDEPSRRAEMAGTDPVTVRTGQWNGLHLSNKEKVGLKRTEAQDL